MTSIIRLTILSGADGESAPCYVLQIDDFRFLLDTGWDEKFDLATANAVANYASKVDAVLLSHSNGSHLGLLPYLVGKCGLDCPVYATLPIWKMGQMFMYDAFLNRHNTEQFSLFDLDDVDAAFDKVVQVQFGSTVMLRGKGQGISLTGYPAGHTLGGTLWRISKQGEQDIVYAIEHNNKKERHLNGSDVDKILRPGVLITSAINALHVQEKRRRRDEMLAAVLGQTLRMGGNVLVATDTAGRSLELALMLDQMWRMRDSGLGRFSLVFLNNVAFNVLEFAKAQIEWMSDKLQKSYESSRTNPFQLRNVILCHTLVELAQVPAPKCVIASSADLESGFARDLFVEWCQDPASCVVLTQRTSPGTLARNLIDEGNNNSMMTGKYVTLDIKRKVRLEGAELEQFRRRSSGAEVNGNVNNHNGECNGGSRKRKFDDDGAEDMNENGVVKRMKQRKSESDSEGLEPPCKYLCVKQTIPVNCAVHFIDFEGRSDVEAAVNMVQEMQPQKLVVVRGSKEATSAFGTLCQTLLPDTRVLRPGIGELLDLTTGNQLMQVTLTDSLMSTLELRKLRGMELAWLDSVVVLKSKTEQKAQRLFDCPTLDTVILGGDELSKHNPVFVNRLRLSEFKQILLKHGIEAEYNDGVLVVPCSNGAVYIQRHSESKELVVECDGLSDEYYKVRELLYQQFAIL